jgi:hypothetical protein
MLNSLFGDLGLSRSQDAPRLQRARSNVAARPGFAARAMVESRSAQLNDNGTLIDHQVRDLFVAGSPAQAMREHFATLEKADAQARLMTLFDPSHIWAPSVIKSLADASGQPIERLNLREHVGLRTLATIERTAIRPGGETLKIYHADIGTPGAGNAEIAMALMERSDLATVIVGRMHPQTIDSLLASLCAASVQPGWRCGTLLFLLPPAASWMADKVAAVEWPASLRVLVRNEPLTSASAVWNTLLGVWNQVKHLEPRQAAESGAGLPPVALGTAAAAMGPSAPGVMPQSASQAGVHTAPLAAPAAATSEQLQAALTMSELARTEGLLGCAVLDAGSGAVLAREQREGAACDIAAVAAAAATLWRTQRHCAAAAGLQEPVDEVTMQAGSQAWVVRALERQAGWLLLGVFDRPHANLLMGRQRLSDVQRTL